MSYGARFWLEFDRVRVDFGDCGKFGDADATEASRMLESASLQDLFKSLREYICDMGGETNIELLTEDSIQFDTKNLTIVAIVKCSREDQFSEQDLQELVRQ